MQFTEEKCAKHLREIRDTIHREVQPIPEFKFHDGDCPGAHEPDFDDSSWPNFSIGEYWGGYDKTAWFRAQVPIPRKWREEKLHLRFLVGPRDGGDSTAETLLYVNGEPLQGIDVWHEEAWIPPEYLQKDVIHIALKAWSGVLGVPERRRFKLAQLIRIDRDAEKYYYLAETLRQAVEVLEHNDLRRSRLLEVLDRSLRRVDFLKPRSDAYYRSLAEAAVYLEERVNDFARVEEIKPKVIALGHAHLDMAWLWRLAHTREKAFRTFSTALNLMRQYPEYRFIHTSPQLYQFLKEDYPAIFERVKERIREGAWEITGGMWVEADTNIPGGESLIRQILFGKRFMREEFGIDSAVVWLPDVFGYTGSLPQIMKKSGIRYFMTTKISWNQYNRFPYDTFRWRGIDGTEILTHFITTPEHNSSRYTYNGVADPVRVKGLWDHYRQKGINDELLLAFGWGDGGGGPTKEMLEAIRAMKNLPGLPRVETGKAESYFQRLKERIDARVEGEVPVWDGELYLEYHRGTYTSQAAVKRANRWSEILFHDAEWMSTLSDVLTGQEYPRARLNRGWEKILLNQFHDILPGSSIRQVYEDARADYEAIGKIGSEVLERAQASLCRGIKADADGIVVFNSLPFDRSGLIELPLSGPVGEETTIVDENGTASPVQVVETNGEKKLLLLARDVPGLGYKTFAFGQGALQSTGLTVRTDLLENDWYRIRLNNRGQIVSLYDKKREREVIASGARANVFQVFEDKPIDFDAWDIDIYYREKMREVDRLIGAEVVEEGPLRGVLRLTWTFSDSVITQWMTLYRDSPRIDFRTEVDWRERQVLLKVAFPVRIRSTKATYDIQFGNIERTTHWNTSWDYARFECPGHKWVDLSEGNYGVSLLNDCKYGHDIKDNVIRLTLIKSPVHPDETADRGRHVFTYGLLPHGGDWRESPTVREAYVLNAPLRTCEITRNETGAFPSAFRFAELDADHVWMETVKKVEEGEAVVFRVYEYKGGRSERVRLSLGCPVKRAVECNLMELEEKGIEVDHDQFSFAITPYEIKTFKVWF